MLAKAFSWHKAFTIAWGFVKEKKKTKFFGIHFISLQFWSSFRDELNLKHNNAWCLFSFSDNEMSPIFHEVRDFFRFLFLWKSLFSSVFKHFGKSLRFLIFLRTFRMQFRWKYENLNRENEKFRYTLIRQMICRPGAIMLWKKGHRVLTAGTMKVSLPSILSQVFSSDSLFYFDWGIMVIFHFCDVE